MKKGKKVQNVTAPPVAAEKFKDLGNQSFSNGNFQKAIGLYTQAIEIEKNAIYYSNRSYAYFELGLYKESLEDAEVAININKEYAKGYLRKVYALRELDAMTEALEAARKGCKLAGKNEVFDKLLEEIEKEYKEVIHRDLVNKYETHSTISIIHDLDDPEIVKINELCGWLKKGGAIFPKIKIKYYEKNYREMAKETPVGKKITAAGLSLLSPKHCYLSTFLLDEKFNPSSWWRPYINMLPTDFDSMPIFFPEDDLMWLEGSPFLGITVREKKSDIKKDYDAILEVAPEFSKYSFWEFCWARMNACSRIYGIIIDGIKTDAFVPLADMLNHRRPKQASWSYSDEKKGFIIESVEDIHRGGNVCESYGKKCNSRFLLNYGFIVLENDGNEVAVKASYKSDDPFLKSKVSLIKENLQSKTFRVMGNVEEKNTLEFLSFLRFVNIRDKQTLLDIMNNQVSEESRNKETYKPQETPPLSIEIEKRVLKDCKKICEEQLKCYPTSLKEDLDLLKTDKLTKNQKNCVLLRLGEKEILHYLIKFAEDCAPLLALSTKEIRKLLIQNPDIKYADYINKAIHTVIQQRENGITNREMDLKYLSPGQIKDLNK